MPDTTENMNLIGHQARWRALARAFETGRAPQTLLISGPPNVGKTTFVWRYAQLLLCPNLIQEDGLSAPCGKCRVCHQVEVGTFPDFRVFRPQISASEKSAAPEELESSNFSIELARDAGDEVLRKPISGPRKVVVFTQFERANDNAENALLKTLEEPPASVTLLLTTENVRQLRATILSRCWHLPLAPVGDDEIARWLDEKFPGAAGANVAASLQVAHGRPGAAFREMERLTSGDEETLARADIAAQMLAKLDVFSPVGALGLTEEATKWAKIWWEEDTGDAGDAKKVGAKGNRSALARFLEELALAGHQKWVGRGALEAHNVTRLDLIRKTRGHILRNANDALALNVMFGQLIALRAPDVSNSRAARDKTRIN